MTENTRLRSRSTASGTPVQAAATLVGVVFLLVGVLGFFPGITADGGPRGGRARVPRRALRHLPGVGARKTSCTSSSAPPGSRWRGGRRARRTFLVGGGAIYLLLFLYGLVVDKDSQANFVPLNRADDWLHLVLGAGMIALGVVLAKRPGTV